MPMTREKKKSAILFVLRELQHTLSRAITDEEDGVAALQLASEELRKRLLPDLLRMKFSEAEALEVLRDTKLHIDASTRAFSTESQQKPERQESASPLAPFGN